MKKILVVIMLISLLTSCADSKKINGVVYKPYGLLDEEVEKSDSIVYRVNPGSVICGIIFVETIIVPVYVVGWNLYEPVKPKEIKK